MDIQITDEKINYQAASLEAVRNKILSEVNGGVDFKKKPWQMGQLQQSLENYLFGQKFHSIKQDILASMQVTDQQSRQKMTDKKIQIYLKSFVVEPTLENNYQSILDNLKRNIKQGFIKQFNLRTLVLNDKAKELVDKNLYNVADRLYQKVQSSAQTLNLDQIQNLVSEMNIIIDQAERTVSDYSKQDKHLTKNPFVWVNAIDTNCNILVYSCCDILNFIINNYQLNLIKDEEEIEQLKVDFKDYCRETIVRLEVPVGKHTPRLLTKAIHEGSNKIWEGTVKEANQSLKKALENKKLTSFADRKYIKDTCFDHYRRHLTECIKIDLGEAPPTDLFFVKSYEKVNQALDALMDESFHNQIKGLKDILQTVTEQLRRYVQGLFQQSNIFAFTTFPQDQSLNIEAMLNYETRRQICILLAFTDIPYTSKFECLETVKMVTKIANVFGVASDGEVCAALQQLNNLSNEESLIKQRENVRLKCQGYFTSMYAMDLPHMVNLIFGLYILVQDLEPEITQMIACKLKMQPITSSPIEFQKRKILLQALRHIRNGSLPLLNYQIVLALDSCLETHRYEYNTMLSTQGQLGYGYSLDYNKTSESFRNMPPEHMAHLLETAHPERLKRNPNNEGPSMEDFITSFIADTKFGGYNNNMYTVDMEGSMGMQQIGPTRGNYYNSSQQQGAPWNNSYGPQPGPYASPLPQLPSKNPFSRLSGILPGNNQNPPPANMPPGWNASNPDLTEQFWNEGAAGENPAQGDIQFTGFAPSFVKQDGQTNSQQNGSSPSPQVAKMKLTGKLAYLASHTNVFHFDMLSKPTTTRAKSSILCVSGFLSEKDNPHTAWKHIVEQYPSTEVTSLNWESFNLLNSATSMLKAMKGVSFRSLTSMFIDSLHDVLPGDKGKQGIFGDKFADPRLKRQGELVDEEYGEIAVANNPFEEDAPTDGYEEGDEGKSPNSKRAKAKRVKRGFFSLFKKDNLKHLFSFESWKKVGKKELNL